MKMKFYPAVQPENSALAVAKQRINELSSLTTYDKIEPETRASLIKMTKKEKETFVRTVHPFKISFLKSRNYYYTKVLEKNGTKKNMTAVTEEGLIGKLYDFYAGPGESVVFRDLVRKMLVESMGVLADKTIEEYNRLWNTYYEGSELAGMKITHITYDMWYEFFYRMIRDNHLTRKKGKQVLIVANKTITYCIRRKILNASPIRDMMQNDFPYSREAAYTTIKARPLSARQSEKIVEWCRMQLENPKTAKVYPLAILFNSRAGLRVGELKGLTWDDVDFERGCISVVRQMVDSCRTEDTVHFTYVGNTMLDHLKACENPRTIPLTEDTLEILRMVKDYGFDDRLVFPMRYHTLNDKVKEAAKYAGISDLSQIRTHTMRVTAAGSLYEKCHSIKTVQAFLGHTQPEMTSKYIKGLDSYEALVGLI